MKEQYISPISIDLGAKNTGVYMAHYKACCHIKNIEKKGKVYKLEKDSYTLLMNRRTAKRHQRRVYDRRQMAKRLFKLIWTKHLNLDWNNDIQQTISFLLNRRGFTFLTEEYNAEILSQFPEAAYQRLPALVKESSKAANYDLDTELNEWSKNKDTLDSIHEALKKEQDKITHELDVIKSLKKLKKYCERIGGQNIPEEKSARKEAKQPQITQRIINEWKKWNVKGLENVPSENTVDLVKFLNGQGSQSCQKISESIPEPDTLKKKEKETKASLYYFPNKFNLEKAVEKNQFHQDGEKRTDNTVFIRTHIQHLIFAISQTKQKLESGSRYRDEYFDEIKKVLENKKHTHAYLKKFCEQLNTPKFASLNLNETSLTNLIGHVSNLELKPLRKYFNDEKHKNGDYWCEYRLSACFENWILREWRVGEKDKRKKQEGEQNYNALIASWKQQNPEKCRRKFHSQDYDKWKQHNKGVVEFWLGKSPKCTIPPYQDNNNRHPPKCQSLVLNVEYLDNKYSEWKKWLEELVKIDNVKKHLSDYEEQLQDLKSSKGKGYFVHKLTQKPQTDSGKRTNAQLKARVLQFILDRVKAYDSLNLNEIYSHAKKIRQNDRDWQDSAEGKEVTEKLKEAICESELPKDLKKKKPNLSVPGNLFEKESFFHFICRYYNTRNKARYARIFIHPEYRKGRGRGRENTGRFNEDDHLMTYCNHKPRQKKHQLLEDLAGLLQITPHQFRTKIDPKNEIKNPVDKVDKVDEWLHKIDALKSNCVKASKEQKDRRSGLKQDIMEVYKHLDMDMKKDEIEKALQRSIVDNADKLYKLCEHSKGLHLQIISQIDETRKTRLQNDIKENPTKSVYFLAQIENIAYKERSGNAKTCAVCSMDNAMRMQEIIIENNGKDETTAKAQRLPAVTTRIIDGAVKRMARIVGKAIATDKWNQVKGVLKDHRVTIPIVTESNRFEFESSLKTLKDPSAKDKRQLASNSKQDRIKQASKGISAYSGAELNSDRFDSDRFDSDKFDSGKEELDHIIPRSKGLLNDEANLICVTKEDNAKKDKLIYGLRNLSNRYKKNIFEETDAKKIKEWIVNEIGDGTEDKFKFGRYSSFISLTPKQQIAFRHALFLPQEDKLRNKVINAIDNRNRALVNGTQRYFAEVLANELYKKACEIGREKALRFDYFPVEASANSKGDSIHDLREELVEEYREDLVEYNKKEGISQKDYSHLIDAQVAFCIALDQHQGEGTFKLDIQEHGLWSSRRVDKTSENSKIYIYDAELYNMIEVARDEWCIDMLKRRLPVPKNAVRSHSHRPLFNENAVAMHFLKLIEVTIKGHEPDYFKGFLQLSQLKECIDNNNYEAYKKYATKLDKDKRQEIADYKKVYQECFPIANGEGTVIYSRTLKHRVLIECFPIANGEGTVILEELRIFSIDKKKASNYLIENFNTAISADRIAEMNSDNADAKNKIRIFNCLMELKYFTQRKNVINTKNNKNNKESIYRLTDNDKKCKKLINPQIAYAWHKLKLELGAINENSDLRRQVKKHFLGKEGSSTHQKVRKVFSLPISCGKGMLIKKHDWQRGDTFYCRPFSNDFSYTVLHVGQNKDSDNRLINIYRRKNIFISVDSWKEYSKMLGEIEQEYAIDPNEFYPIKNIPEKYNIAKAFKKRTDANRTRVKFQTNAQEMKERNAQEMEKMFSTFMQFMCEYPCRSMTDAKWVKSYKEQEWKNPDQLKNLTKDKEALKEALEKELKEALEKELKELKKELKELKKELKALGEIQELYEKYKEGVMFEYIAALKFTSKKL